jgi:hypothetical protein
LRKVPDRVVAERVGVSHDTVVDERRRRGIPPAVPRRPRIEWTEEMMALLGTATDREVAEELDVNVHSVSRKRRILGIPAYCERPTRPGFWTPRRIELLGTAPDSVVARKLRIPLPRVANRRQILGIAPFTPQSRVRWTPAMRRLLGKVARRQREEEDAPSRR